MNEYISGVAERVLSAGHAVQFEVQHPGILKSSIPGTDVRHTAPLQSCTERAAGNAVGENLVSAADNG